MSRDAGDVELYEFNQAAVEAWVAVLYRVCEPKTRDMTPEQAADYIARVSERTLARMQREDPDLYAKTKRMLTRPAGKRTG